MAEPSRPIRPSTGSTTPACESHPGHERASELLRRASAAWSSFELKGGLDGRRAVHAARLTLPIVAPSLGGVETLVTRPATTSHAGMRPEEREAAGISDSLIRLSVGIEDTQDLIDDFDNALRE